MMVMQHGADMTFDLQIVPAIVSPGTVTVTVGASGLQPPYEETLEMEAGSVRVFSLPPEVMASGVEQAAKAVHISASADIGKIHSVL